MDFIFALVIGFFIGAVVARRNEKTLFAYDSSEHQKFLTRVQEVISIYSAATKAKFSRDTMNDIYDLYHSLHDDLEKYEKEHSLKCPYKYADSDRTKLRVLDD